MKHLYKLLLLHLGICLSWVSFGQTFEFEPNNTPESKNSIVEKPIIGSIADANDKDYFSYYPSNKGNFTAKISIANIPSSTTVTVRFYSADPLYQDKTQQEVTVKGGTLTLDAPLHNTLAPYLLVISASERFAYVINFDIEKAPFDVNITSDLPVFCAYSKLGLTANISNNTTAPFSYTWFDESGQIIGRTPNISVSERGYYKVEVTDKNGYKSFDTKYFWTSPSFPRPRIYTNLCSSKYNVAWDKTFGGTQNDLGNVVQATPDGGLLVAGVSASPSSGNKSTGNTRDSNIWLFKLDERGNKVWEKVFGMDKLNIVQSMISLPDNGLLLAGYTYGTTTQLEDYYVIRLDSQGNILWEKRYGGKGNDRLHTAISTNDGGFLLVGDSNSPSDGINKKSTNYNNSTDWWIVKIDAKGNALWDKNYGSTFNDNVGCVTTTPDGNYLIGGAYAFNYKLIKFDSEGQMLWQSESYEAINSVVAIGNDIFTIENRTLTKRDNTGKLLWSKDFYRGQLGVSPDNKLIFLSSRHILQVVKEASEGLRGESDAWIAQLDTNGVIEWEKTLGASDGDNLRSFVVQADGKMVLVGSSNSNKAADKSQDSFGEYDVWVVKLKECDGLPSTSDDVTTLHATGCANSTVVWNDGTKGISIKVKPTETTIYTAACQTDNCTSEADSIVVASIYTPTVSGENLRLCQGASTTLYAKACAGSLSWSNGETNSTIVVSPQQTTTYWATCRVNNTDYKNSIKVEVMPKPNTPSVSSSTASLCEGTSLLLEAKGCDNGQIYWSGGLIGNEVQFMPSQSSTYKAVCVQNLCKSDSSTTLAIQVKSTPTAPIIASTLAMCDSTTQKQYWDKTFFAAYTYEDNINKSQLKAISVGDGHLLATSVYSVASEEVGRRSVVLVRKITDNGILQWQKVYAKDTYTYTTFGSIISTQDKGVLIASHLPSLTGSILTKTDRDGTVLWEKEYKDNVVIKAMLATPDGSYWLAGNKYTDYWSSKCWAAKVDHSGKVIWEQEYDLGEENTVSTLAMSPAGDFFFGGTDTKSQDIFLVKLDASGNKVWNKSIGGTNEDLLATDIILSSKADGFILGASSLSDKGQTKTSANLGNYDYWLIKIDFDGNIIWDKTYGSQNKEILSSIMITPEGYYVLGGSVGEKAEDWKIMGVDADGKLLWEKTFGGSGTDILRQTIRSNDGQLLLAGFSTSGISGNKTTETQGMWVLKTGICENLIATNNATLTLTASGCKGAVLWSNQSKANPITVNATSQLTHYTATCLVDGCASPLSNRISVISSKGFVANKPIVSASQTTICKGETTVLSAEKCENALVHWNTGEWGTTLVVRPAKTQIYKAVCSYKNAISDSSNAITINVKEVLAPTITANKTNVCDGSQATITAQGCQDGQVVWSTGSIGRSILVSTDSILHISAKCVNSCSSIASDTITLKGPKTFSPPFIAARNVCKDGILQQWDKAFGTDQHDFLTKVIATKDNGYLLGGSTEGGLSGDKSQANMGDADMWVVKMDKNQQKQWDYALGGSQVDVLIDMVETPTGEIIIAGRTFVEQKNAFWIAKLDAQGHKIWDKKIVAEESVWLNRLLLTSDNSLILVGNTYSNKIWMVKATQEGAVSWSKWCTMQVPPTEIKIILTSDKGVLVGYSDDYITYLLKTDIEGNKLWDYEFRGGVLSEHFMALMEGADKSYWLASIAYTATGINLLVHKVAPSGTKLWSKLYNPRTETSIIPREILKADDGCWVVGNKGTMYKITETGDLTDVKQITYERDHLKGIISESTKDFVLFYDTSEDFSADKIDRTRGNSDYWIRKVQFCTNADTNPTLTAIGCSNEVLWSNNMTGTSITVPYTSARYTAICQTATCKSANSNSIYIKPPDAPVLSASKTKVCSGETISFNATGCDNGTVEWSNGMQGHSISMKVTKESSPVKARCVVANAPSSYTDLFLDITTIPTPFISSTSTSKTTICEGEILTLNAITDGYDAIWNSGENTNKIVVSPRQTQTYRVIAYTTINNAICYSDSSEAVTINVKALPQKPILQANNTAICLGQSTVLNASGCQNGTIYWTDKRVGPSIVVAPIQDRIYRAVCKQDLCTSDSVEIAIKVSPTPEKPRVTSNLCIGGVNIRWDRTWGRKSNDNLSTIIKTDDGGYLIGGTSDSRFSDFWIIKINSAGEKEWDKIYGGTEGEKLASIVRTKDGNYLLAGTSYSSKSNDKSQNNLGASAYWVVKIDAQGNKLWDKTIGGNRENDLINAMTCSDGGFILSGRSNSDLIGDRTEPATYPNDLIHSADYWIVKIDANGNKIWDKTERPNMWEIIAHKTVAVENNQYYYVAGHNEVQYTGGGIVHIWVAKYDLQGRTIWKKWYKSSFNDYLADMLVLPNGNLVLGITSYGDAREHKSEDSKGSSDYWLLQINPDGQKVWDKSYGTSSWDDLNSVITTADGGFLLAGQSAGIDKDKSEDNRDGSTDFWLVRTDNTGKVLWNKTIGGNHLDINPVVLAIDANSWILGGTSYSSALFDKTEPNITGAYNDVLADYWIMNFTACQEQASPPMLTVNNCVGEVTWNTGAKGKSITIDPNITAKYQATCTNDKACSATGEFFIVNYPKKPAKQQTAVVVCNKTTTLEANNCPNGAVHWSTGEIGNRINVTLPDSLEDYQSVVYQAYCVRNGIRGETSTFELYKPITVSQIKVASSKKLICVGESVSLSASNCNGAYKWRHNSSSSSTENVAPTVTTTYEVLCIRTSEDCDADSTTASVTVQVAPKLEQPIIQASALNVCKGSSTTLTVSNCNGTVAWSDGTIGNTLTVKPVNTQEFFRAICRTDNCASPISEPIKIQVVDKIAAPSIVASNATICQGVSTTLSLNGCNGTPYWSNGQTGNSIVVSPPKTQNFRAICKQTTCSSDSSNAFTVNVTPLPVKPTITVSNPTDTSYVVQWDKTLGGSLNDINGKLISLSDGSYVIAGTSNSSIGYDKSDYSRGVAAYGDYWIIKLNNKGEKLWDKTFGGTYEETLVKIIATKDGGMLLAGESYSDKSSDKTEERNGKFDYWIVKLDENGNKLWDKTIGGLEEDHLSDVIQTSDGGYLLAGFSSGMGYKDKSQNGFGGVDYWVVKIDARGNKLWDKSLGGTNNDILRKIIETQQGDIILGGTSASAANQAGYKTSNNRQNDIWLVKFNANGDYIWDKKFLDEGDESLLDMTILPNNNLILGGINTSNNILLCQIDEDGTVLWNKKYPRTATRNGNFRIRTTVNQEIVLGGGSTNCWLLTLDKNGNFAWEKNYFTSTSCRITDFVCKSDKSIVMVGDTPSDIGRDKTEPSRGSFDLWVVKIALSPEDTYLNVLTASKCDGTVTWSNQRVGQNIFIDPAVPQSYTAICTQQDCVSPISDVVKFDGKPNVPVITADKRQVCIGSAVLLKASGCSSKSITWSDGSQGASLLVYPTSNKVYKAVCRQNNMVSDSSSISIEVGVQKPQKPIITADKSLTCIGSEVTLSSSGCNNGVVSWTGGLVGQKVIVRPAQTSTYSAVCTNIGCISDSSAALTISAKPKPNAPYIYSSVTTVCPGSPVLLLSSGCTSGNAKWNIGLSGNMISVPAKKNQTYRAICSQDGCVSDSSNVIQPEVLPAPNPPIISAKPICTLPVTLEWSSTIQGDSDDRLTDILATSDGGYLLGGYSLSSAAYDKSTNNNHSDYYDYWIVKVDAQGKKIWDKTFGSVEAEYFSKILATTDGNYLLTGTGSSGTSATKKAVGKGNLDYWIIKIDKNGNTIWDKSFGGSSFDILSSAHINSKGEILLAGFSGSTKEGDRSEDSRGEYDYWVIKLNSNGDKLWDKSFGTTGFDYLRDVTLTSDNHYILAGTSADAKNGDKTDEVKGLSDFWIIKIDQNGKKIWDKTFNGSGYSTHDLVNVAALSNGNMVIGGTSYAKKGFDKSQDSYNSDLWVLKIDANGKKIWDKTIQAISAEQFGKLTVTNDENLLLAGTSNSASGLDKSSSSELDDYWIVKLDKNGQKLWDRTYVGNLNDNLTSMVDLGNDTFVLAGYSQSNVGFDKDKTSIGMDYWILKGEICSEKTSTTYELTAKGCEGGVQWSNNAIGTSIVVSSSKYKNTYYTATCTNTCTSPKSNIIVIGDSTHVDAPTITSYYTTICQNTTATLTSLGCEEGTVIWSNGQKGASIDVSPSVTTRYKAKCQYPWASSAFSNELEITVLPSLAKPAVVASQNSICKGSSATLTATGCTNGSSANWINLGVGNTMVVSPTTTTTYTVFCANTTCTSDSVQITIGIKGTPTTPTIEPNVSTVCQGTPTTLVAKGCTNGTVTWNNGYQGSSFTTTADKSRSFRAICNIGGCYSDSSSVAQIVVKSKPNAPVLYSSVPAICSNEMASVYATGCNNGTINWKVEKNESLFTGQSISFIPFQGQVVKAVCQSNDGCKSDSSVALTINLTPAPAPPTVTASKLACDNPLLSQWNKTLGGNGEDLLSTIVPTSDGGFLLGGRSNSKNSGDKSQTKFGYVDYWVMKVTKDGNKVWDNTFGNTGWDELTSILPLDDGGFLLGGFSNSLAGMNKTAANKGGTDYWVIKIDANGNKIWDKTFGGTQNDQLASITKSGLNGYYFLSGTSSSNVGQDKTNNSFGGTDYWVVLINEAGQKQWDKTIGSANDDNLTNAYFDKNLYLSGTTWNKAVSKGLCDFWVVKMDMNKNILWEKTFGGEDYDIMTSIAPTKDNGLLLGGHSWSGKGTDKSASSKGKNDYWVVKIDQNTGTKSWDKTFGGDDYDYLTQIVTLEDGFIIGGYSYSNKSTDKADNAKGGSDFWLFKIDDSGNKLWDKTIGGTQNDNMSVLLTNTRGELLMAGSSYSDKELDKAEPNKATTATADWWVMNTLLCSPSKQATMLTATGCDGTITWSNGQVGSSIIVNPTSTTSYYAVCKAKTGCYSTSFINVNSFAGAIGANTSPTSDTTVAKNLKVTVNLTFDDAAFKVYPNPTIDEVFVSTNLTGSNTFILYDVIGNIVLREEFESSAKYNIKHLPRGAYFYHIQNEKSTTTGKLILER